MPDDLAIRVDVDFNARDHSGNVVARIPALHAQRLEAGRRVFAYDPADRLRADAVVDSFDPATGKVVLAVDWDSFVEGEYLRTRYEDAIAEHMDGGPYRLGLAVDAVLVVRDDELELLRVVEVASVGAHALLADAEAGLASVRRLHPSRAEANAQQNALCIECASPAPCLTRRTLDGDALHA